MTRRLADTCAIGSVLLAILLAPLVAGAPEWLILAPLVVSALLFGMPHGAVDHVILFELRGSWFVPTAAYAAAALVCFWGWVVSPNVAFAAFIAITWLHWGMGDVAHLRQLGQSPMPQSGLLSMTSSFVRGGIPMLVPLIAFPDIYADVARAVTGAMGGRGPAVEAFKVASAWILGVGLIAHFVVAFRHRGRWMIRDMGEVFILVVMFAILHPLFAVGIYFCLWHSTRHIARLTAWYNTRRDGGASGRVLWRDMIPTTAIALAAVLIAWRMLPTASGSAMDLVGVYLVIIACLTVPHMATVFLMDIRDGLLPGASEIRG